MSQMMRSKDMRWTEFEPSYWYVYILAVGHLKKRFLDRQLNFASLNFAASFFRETL